MTRQTTSSSGHAPLPPPYMTAHEVASTLQVSRRTVDYLVAAGKLPQPIRLTRKTVRWLRSDIEALGSREPA